MSRNLLSRFLLAANGTTTAEPSGGNGWNEITDGACLRDWLVPGAIVSGISIIIGAYMFYRGISFIFCGKTYSYGKSNEEEVASKTGSSSDPNNRFSSQKSESSTTGTQTQTETETQTDTKTETTASSAGGGSKSSAKYKRKEMSTFFKSMFVVSQSAFLMYGVISMVTWVSVCHMTYAENAAVFLLMIFLYFNVLLPCLLLTLTARMEIFDKLPAQYHTKKCVLTAFRVGVGIIVALDIITFISVVGWLLVPTDTAANSLFDIIINISLILSIVLYLIEFSCLVYLFVHKLNKVIRMIDDGSEHLLPVQETLIRIESKHLVVAACAWSTTVFEIILFILLFGSGAEIINTGFLGHINVIDALCNAICLYLQFNFAEADYQRLCWRCDGYCNRKWTEKAKRKLQKPDLNNDNEQDEQNAAKEDMSM